MKLASLKDTHRDGALIVVSSDNARYVRAHRVAPSLQAALDDWERAQPELQALSDQLATGEIPGEPLHTSQLTAPLPRAYEWVDGSAFLNHVRLVRQARGAQPPATLMDDPLVYQGGSGVLLGPTDDIALCEPEAGLDFEGEVCVVLGDTPRGTTAEQAGDHIRLVMLCNDVTLRNLIPNELAKGFGFFQSKPATAFSPFAVTPDELGDHLEGGRLHLTLRTRLNGEVVGDCDAGPEMHFGFHELVAHIARTRSFTAGTILGSGTVSNTDAAAGVSCLSEARVRELIEQGEVRTPYLVPGDHVQMDVHDRDGHNLFGTIDQRVVSA